LYTITSNQIFFDSTKLTGLKNSSNITKCV
jgi:hypothetical protein